MSLNNEFRNTVLFHGSPFPFRPGDIVEPRGSFETAYATTDLHEANDYGRGKAQSNAERDQSSVYHVEPLEDDDSLQMAGNYALSKKGFRVVRKVRVD